MIIPKCALSLIALLPVSAMAAADLDFWDLRVGAGVLSNNFEGASSTTVTNNTSNISTTTDSSEDGRDAESNYRGQIQLVWGNLGTAGGLILGGGIAVNNARFDNSSQDAEVSIPVVNVLAGYGYAVSKNWHFELTPFAGAGRAYYNVTDYGSSKDAKNAEKYYEYGAKIGTYVTSDDGLQLGIDVPYLVGRFNPKYDQRDDDNSYSVSDSRRNTGFGLLVTLGKRF